MIKISVISHDSAVPFSKYIGTKNKFNIMLVTAPKKVKIKNCLSIFKFTNPWIPNTLLNPIIIGRNAIILKQTEASANLFPKTICIIKSEKIKIIAEAINIIITTIKVNFLSKTIPSVLDLLIILLNLGKNAWFNGPSIKARTTLITLPDAVKYPTFRFDAKKPRITTLLVVYKLIETEDKNKFHPSTTTLLISFILGSKKEILKTFVT